MNTNKMSYLCATLLSGGMIVMASHDTNAQVRGAGVAPNDECRNGISITDGATPFDTSIATDSVLPEATCDFPFGDQDIHKDVWFTYLAAEDGTLLVDTCGDNDFDTRLAVYAGADCPPVGAPLECNDDWDNAMEGDTGPACAPGTFEASLSVEVTQGAVYTIRVGLFTAAGVGGGPDVLNVSLVPSATGRCCVDSPEPCPADIGMDSGGSPGCGADGTVDTFDLLVMLGEWQSTGTCADIASDPSGPLSGAPDGVVDTFDLLLVLSEWGDCPTKFGDSSCSVESETSCDALGGSWTEGEDCTSSCDP